MNYWQRFTGWIFGSEIARRVSLAVAALDDFRDRQISGGREGDRDRFAYDREEILRDALEAWRLNPLARRIVSLTSEYVVGGGLRIEADDPATNDFLQEWWDHRLNRMGSRVFEWCDELTRTGELFPLLSTDASGMTYMRAVPATDVGEIVTAANDVEQEQAFLPVTSALGDAPPWIAYREEEDDGTSARMVHYALNRPVGAVRGESDLAPILRWLRRHNQWLEDRVRLNHFRQAFLFVVHKAFGNEADRLARQSELNMNPPNPGTILVVDDSEQWEVIHPNLDSFEASEDGLSVKKQIAVGVGFPLHFIAEPESSTRTTAEQAGGPAFRHFERRQLFFFWLLEDVARIVVRRRSLVDGSVKADVKIKVVGTDIFQRDNASLAVAGSTIINAFMQLREHGMIDDEELLRLAYKFAGETADVKELLRAGKVAGPLETVASAPTAEGAGAAAVKSAAVKAVR